MYNNNNYPSIDMIRSKMDQVMVVPELSLGPSISIDQKSTTTSSSLTSDQSTETARSLKKRKSFNDHIVQTNNKPVVGRRSLDDFFLRDGQVKRDRLPLDWEQCLDLKSGKIYFLNRKTAEKVCDRPTVKDDHHHHHQSNEKPPLELELNISSPTSSSTHSNSSFKLSQKTSQLNDQHKPTYSSSSTSHHCHPIKAVTDSRATTTATTTIPTTATTTTSSVVGSNNMVALACSNCHLLVILSKSSPSCPNCKYVHYLHSTDDQHDFKAYPNRNMKPVNTLSLFS